jgi:hypothetical protein
MERWSGGSVAPVDGTLTDFRETGPCSGNVHWHDRDGSSTVPIRSNLSSGASWALGV